MSEDTSTGPEVLFRANKRRKIFRKRNIDSDDQNQNDLARLNSLPENSSLPGEEDVDGLTSLVQRPAMKKKGIAFSSSGRPAISNNESDMAMVPFQDNQTEVYAESDRFIKPMGKTEIVEDKHLTAYVDSKLAELRSSTATSAPTQADQAPENSLRDELNDQPAADLSKACDPASQFSASARQLSRKSHPHDSRQQSRKPRRQPPSRDENALAREAMVDAILSESQVPIYDHAAPPNPAPDSTTLDADEAAAEAFKAEFLAGLGQGRRRRPQPPPTGSKTAQVSSGPKLGGSRSQREKMKALGEAKIAAGKK